MGDWHIFSFAQRFFPGLQENIPKLDDCGIDATIIREMENRYNSVMDIVKIIILIFFCIMMTIGFILCVFLVSCVFILTCVACLIVSVPCFLCCVKKRVKQQVNRQKEELLEGLLKQDQKELETSPDILNVDVSSFNLDYNDFKIEKEISAGGSGALCFQAIHKKDGEKVFMKMFSLKKNSDDDEYDMKEFQNEIKLFTRLRFGNFFLIFFWKKISILSLSSRHANIVNFYGFFCAPPSRVGYICEFCSDGTLSTLIKMINSNKISAPKKANTPKVIKERQDIDTPKKINFLIQIAKGMRYLHQKGIIFRDLKPENILIGMNDTLKLTDFGISKTINLNSNNKMTMKAGTSLYMAPEVVEGKSDYDQKVDVFSFGILAFDLIFETVDPYGQNPPFGIDFKIATGSFFFICFFPFLFQKLNHKI